MNCPGCGNTEITLFYKVNQVPVHSVLLFHDRDEAINYPKGDINLGFCNRCGFIFNTSFDKDLHEYSSQCEETQGFSKTFTNFHKRLGKELVDRHNLQNKHIIEIGCGKGEFLVYLCELGNNSGIGIDPAYIENRIQSKALKNITFIKDLYSEKYLDGKADLICCKMTLEHILNTSEFVQSIRHSITNENTVVFFQIPDSSRIFRNFAFWDVYYEHSSYFYEYSLKYLFEFNDFTVSKIWKEYNDQYLLIEANANMNSHHRLTGLNENIQKIKNEITYFSENYQNHFNYWKKKIREFHSNNKKTILWGGGSKAVAFLTTLGITDEIQIVVDINPYKNKTYIAGTGQYIVNPDYLETYKPDVVIIMNSIYTNEIKNELAKMGLHPEIIAI